LLRAGLFFPTGFIDEVIDMPRAFNIGFDTYIPDSEVMMIVSPNSAPIKRKIEVFKTLIDATFGKKT